MTKRLWLAASFAVSCGKANVCDLDVGAATGTYRVSVGGDEAIVQIDANGRADTGTGHACTAVKSRPCTLTVTCDDGTSVSIARVAAP